MTRSTSIMRISVLSVLLLILSILASACGGAAATPTPTAAPRAATSPTTAASTSASPTAAAASPTKAATTPTTMAAGKPSYDKPVRISFSTWTGYGLIWLAKDKGFFKQNGIDVQIQLIESPGERFNALAAGSLDGMASSLDAFTRVGAQGIPVVQVVGLDESLGGDGIVAKKEIQSIKDLKGKTVAVNIGSTSHWFLANVLAQNGMSLNDVKIQDMTAGDAGAAFVAGKVDAAVTWEPWLSRAQKTDFGHTLVTTKDYPGLIVDTFGFRRDFAQQHPDVVVAFLKGLAQAYDYWQKNPDDAIQVMATEFKQKPEDVKADLQTIKLFSIADSKQYFGTPQNPGPIYKVSEQIADFWMQIKVIDKKPDVNQLIDPSFLQQVS
ncbi:MAG: ABC transporter substrate-binding protein [Thermorudis peleae]|nr:ABC transporter substrate-binding protein [Thermorudis peleae]